MEEPIWAALSEEQGLLFNSLIQLNKSKTIVEIGVAFGTTTAWLCDAATKTGGHVFGYDVWNARETVRGEYENDYQKYSGIKKKNTFQQTGDMNGVNIYIRGQGYTNFTLTQIDSRSDEFPAYLKSQCPVIDFAFIDGDHSYNGIKNDFSVVYPLMSQTGIVAFHDTQRIDGCREFVLDLRTKYNDGTFDIVDFPFGNQKRRVGISVLVKRTFPILDIPIDEICGSPSITEDIIKREKEWYRNQTGKSK